MTLARALALALVLGLASAAGLGRADPPTAPDAPRVEDEPWEPLFRRPIAELFPDPDARALALAAAQGRLEEVERLVRTGVDVNYRGVSGFTPLLAALRSPQGFEKLLALGADPNLDYTLVLGGKTREGSVLHVALLEDRPRMLEIALRHGADPNRLGRFAGDQFPPLAYAYPDVEAMRVLLDAGAAVDGHEAPIGSRADEGETLAMSAAHNRDFAALYLLLTRGADYTLRNDRGQSVVAAIAAWSCEPPANTEQLRQDEELRQKVIAWLRERGALGPGTDCPTRPGSVSVPKPSETASDEPGGDPRVRALVEAAGDSHPGDPVTPQELYAEGARYDGKRLVVRGFLTRARCLYQSQERYQEWNRGFDEDDPDFDPNQYDHDGLVLLNADRLIEHDKELAGRNVALKGVFMRNYLDGKYLDLDACGDAALILDESEVQRLLKSLR